MAIDTERIPKRRDIESLLPQRMGHQQRDALLAALDNFHNDQHEDCFRSEPLTVALKAALKAYGEADPVAPKLKKINKSVAVHGEIAASFVLPEHMMAIQEVAAKRNIVISIRESGTPTLERLREGALPKPHSILEKTIKKTSLDEHADGAGAGIFADLRKLRDETGVQLLGCVGHWEETGDKSKRLLGIRVANLDAVKGADNEKLCRKKPGTGELYFPVDTSDYEKLKQSVEPLRLPRNARWFENAYTGDYDLHDVIIRSGASSHHAITGKETTNVVQELNRAMPEPRRLDPSDARDLTPHSLFQHGPQGNYYAQMRVEGATPDEKTSAASYPVAVCDGGRWFIVRNARELEQSYNQYGAQMKGNWRQDIQGKPVAAFRQFSPSASRRGSLASIGSESGSGDSSSAQLRRSSMQMTNPQRRSSASDSRRNSAIVAPVITDSPQSLSPASSPRLSSTALPQRRGSLGPPNLPQRRNSSGLQNLPQQHSSETTDNAFFHSLLNYTMQPQPDQAAVQRSSASRQTAPSPLDTVPQSPVTASFSSLRPPSPRDKNSPMPNDTPAKNKTLRRSRSRSRSN